MTTIKEQRLTRSIIRVQDTIDNLMDLAELHVVPWAEAANLVARFYGIKAEMLVEIGEDTAARRARRQAATIFARTEVWA